MKKINYPETLGAVVRSARKRLGLTQSELALTAGVGMRFIVDLEKGKPTMRLEQVMRVIHVLGGMIKIAGLDDHGSFHEELLSDISTRYQSIGYS